MRLIILSLITIISLTACKDEGISVKSPCEGRQWKDPSEALNCKYPSPPHGRWHAVYTEKFATKYDLPKENISKDLSEGVDYVEMDVQPYAYDVTTCMVNMLIQRPNDMALYNATQKHNSWAEEKLNQNRKHIHHLNIDVKDVLFRPITTVGFASRHKDNRGFRTSTFAFYSDQILEGYDYISANAGCRKLSLEKKHFPDNFALSVSKASVWGKNELRYKSADNPNSPQGKAFYKSRTLLNIPSEIVSTVFKDVPVGGR